MELEYYDYTEIDNTHANYRIVIGERSNGKTYGFKKKALINFFETGKQFAYVRRSVEEIKLKRVNQYFADMGDFLDSLGKKYYPQYDYIHIKVEQGRFDLYGCDLSLSEDILIDTIGFYFALNQTRYDKTVAYPNVNMICWDEFLTNEGEHNNEFSMFLNLISTIKRKRTDMVIYMLANTVSRNSKIMRDFGINLREIPQGTIKCFAYENESGNTNTVAVEYCRHYEQTRESESFFVFNNPRAMMITHGSWEVDDYPHYDKEDLFPATHKPEMAIILTSGDIYLFAYIIDNKLLISDKREYTKMEYFTIGDVKTRFDRNQFNFHGMNPVTTRIIKMLWYYYSNGLVFYNSNLTGDDFTTFINDLKAAI